MPVVVSTEQQDDTFHYFHDHLIHEAWSPSRDSGGATPLYQGSTLPVDQQWPPEHSRITDDAHVFPNSYTPPAYADDYYGYGGSHGSDIDQQMTDIQTTLTTDDDDDENVLATPSDDEETANLTPEELSQRQFDQDVMVYYRSVDSALASEFLNLDAHDEDLPCFYQVTTDGSQSPASSSATSPSLGTPAEADIAQSSNRPLDSSLLDGGDFDAFPLFGNAKNTAGWPWGDFTYRPRTPEQYLDPVEYLMEDQLREEAAIAREELSELMLQEAIRDGVRETRREERPERRERRKRVKIDHPTATRAFNNQVIRGRTIYNP